MRINNSVSSHVAYVRVSLLCSVYFRLPELAAKLTLPETVLLYPGQEAEDLVTLPVGTYNLVILDGTWREAKSIYRKNIFLHSLRKVCEYHRATL